VSSPVCSSSAAFNEVALSVQTPTIDAEREQRREAFAQQRRKEMEEAQKRTRQPYQNPEPER